MTTTVVRRTEEGVEPATRGEARPAVRPWFLADWRDVTFVHYSIDPSALQPHVPFELDLYEGRAWVSVVAFTQDQFRPARLTALLGPFTTPVARHEFLNLRTYVRAHGCRAIYFLAEWIPNRLAMAVGPRLYGLPFRLGRLEYEGGHRAVTAREGTFEVEMGETCAGGEGLAHFLLERYTAFTCRHGCGRMFHIDHAPWAYRPVAVRVERDDLIRRAAPWFAAARFACAHHSPGAFDVKIGRPLRMETTRPGDVSAARSAFAPPLGAAAARWLPLLALVAMAIVGLTSHPAWVRMWGIAFALYAGCKWATWFDARPTAARAPAWRSTLYLLAWPGMNAANFLASRVPSVRGVISMPLIRTILGAAILLASPLIATPLLSGWVAMVGLVMALHFGAFDVLSTLYGRAGVHAPRVMDAPLRARSLGEFWGRRWNTAFRDLAHAYVLSSLLRRRVPLPIATLTVFLVSGVVHDLVISVPAGVGLGWPTAYFLAQGAGVLLQKSRWGRRRLRGAVGRAFAVAVVVGPLPLLFHAGFVLRVVVPFARVLSPF